MSGNMQTVVGNKADLSLAARAKKAAQRGALSLELGLVLLVLAVLVAAAVIRFIDNSRKNSINDNVEALNFIGSNTIAKYGKQNQYAQATTANAVRNLVIPKEMRDGLAVTASNPFGAQITLTPLNLTGTNDAVRIDWGNIPSNQCSDIVTGVQGTFRQITVAGTNVKPLDGVIDLTALETQCESAGVNASVAAQFFVGRS